MSTILYENERLTISSEVANEKKHFILKLKESDVIVATYSEVYLDTIHDDKLIVRSDIPPYLSGVIDLNLVGTDQNPYCLPTSYFKVIFEEGIGYLVVFSPNDCILMNFNFKPIPPGRCSKISITDDQIVGERCGDKKIVVPRV